MGDDGRQMQVTSIYSRTLTSCFCSFFLSQVSLRLDDTRLHSFDLHIPQVYFETSLPSELKVTTTPFAVPARLSRLGLSEVINHLLELPKVLPS